jgi:hypothetical protein
MKIPKLLAICLLLISFLPSLHAGDWSEWQIIDAGWPGVRMRTRLDENSGQGYGDNKYKWDYELKSAYSGKTVKVYLGFWKLNRSTNRWEAPGALTSGVTLQPGETHDNWQFYFKKEIFNFTCRIEDSREMVLRGDLVSSTQADLPSRQALGESIGIGFRLCLSQQP